MSAGIDAGTRAASRWLGAGLAVISAAMLACGGGDSSTVTTSGPTTTVAAAEVTSTAPVTVAAVTTTVARTATTVAAPGTQSPSITSGPGAACPSSPLPPNVTNVTTGAGSFDGDGQPDVLRAYQAANVWHLRVELSSGGEVDVTVPNIGTGDAVKAVGGFNIDEGLGDEIFATVGSGSYATLVGLWKGGGFCQLTRVTVNGQPATFPVGASVSSRSGVRCIPGTAFQVLETQSTNGTQYTGTIANYDLVGSALVHANTSPPQVLAASHPDLALYGKLTCGGLVLP